MEEDQITMQTPAAKLQPKQQYLNLMMNSLANLNNLLSGPDKSTDIIKKIGFLVRMHIAYIPNPKERDRLLKYRDEELEKAKCIKDSDDRADFIFEMNAVIVGEITTLLDDILAIVERQEILESGDSVTNDLEKEFYPDGLPEYEDYEAV